MAKAKLSEYSAKRRFDATPEPAGVVPAGGTGPLLFVVQQHSARRLHFDFRLECDGVLKSWAVPKGPSLDPADKRLAVQTEDHPYDYASFEGVIPPGQYGAGEVIVWDCGVYSPDEKGTCFDDRARAEREVREGLEKGKLGVQLRGEKLKGSFALVRTKGAKSSGKEWLLIKHKDRFVTKDDPTRRDRSVLSGVAVAEMKFAPAHRIAAAQLVPAGEARAMPARLSPMLAETGEQAFDRPGWMWEPKLDGYRALAFVGDEGVRLGSRRGLELGGEYPRLAAELAQQDAPMILDGEIVAFDAAGRPSFHAMQNRRPEDPAVFYAFDLLWFAGIDLRARPYEERRRFLAQCLLPTPHVQLVHAQQDGVALADAALASGFEGVIGKRKDARYEAGKRSSAWLKVKPVKSAEFVIGGYTRGKGSRAPLGALLVGTWVDGKLVYASHVGSGFDDRALKALKAKLAPLERRTRPFANEPERNAPTVWVEPKLVAEIEFHSWTGDGHLRAPVFLRLRDDLDPRQVRRAPAAPAAPRGEIDDIVRQLDAPKAALTLAVGAERIKLTHLDRVYWPASPALRQPALTKRDLLRYLARISPYMLPHLADRPLTLIRMPEGIEGERFYQKHWTQARPGFVDTLQVHSDHKDESHEVLVCNNLATLLWLAQSGTLEFHVWHSRAKPGPDTPVTGTDFASAEGLDASILSYPDYVVFDIDPYIYSGKEAPGEEPELNTVAFEKGKEVAFRLRELLHTMRLEPIVKTSGKTGLHVFVPIRRTLDFAAARHVSELVGRHLVRLHPKEITQEWSVPKRTGKIFMDFNMNVRGKTLNAAYSPRGAPGGPVSMPLDWEELAAAHPLDFRISNAAERLSATGDRWSDALSRKQSLEGALEHAKP
ncbi:MAG TPA: DNA ligase D [Burkholderiales bacterium]|nr:DNA ligase D [Burkholderiales bacterium]